jgi:hypothetical protein
MHAPSFLSLNKTTGMLSLHIEDYISTKRSVPARHSASPSSAGFSLQRLSQSYFIEIFKQIPKKKRGKKV